MKRKLVYIPIIIIITGLIITFSIIINNSIILTRIYYKINYKGDTQNLETLIEKSELFEYDKYCKYRDSWGEGPINNSDCYYCYIDKDFIESLKLKIDKEKKRFHFYPHFSHNLIYSVEVTNESLIYLTYNNNNIIKAEYANRTEISLSVQLEKVLEYISNNIVNKEFYDPANKNNIITGDLIHSEKKEIRDKAYKALNREYWGQIFKNIRFNS